jgi:hypothetical protein
MAQEKRLRLSHFVPDGYPQVYPGSSAEVKQMMPYLIERAPKRWTKVPNHDIEILATLKKDVPSLGFRKNAKEVYVHIFCNEFINPLNAMHMVVSMYIKFDLGEPTFIPKELNWIHSIPLPGGQLTNAETMLIHQLTQSMFWTIYMDFKQRGPTRWD